MNSGDDRRRGIYVKASTDEGDSLLWEPSKSMENRLTRVVDEE